MSEARGASLKVDELRWFGGVAVGLASARQFGELGSWCGQVLERLATARRAVVLVGERDGAGGAGVRVLGSRGLDEADLGALVRRAGANGAWGLEGACEGEGVGEEGAAWLAPSPEGIESAGLADLRAGEWLAVRCGGRVCGAIGVVGASEGERAALAWLGEAVGEAVARLRTSTRAGAAQGDASRDAADDAADDAAGRRFTQALLGLSRGSFDDLAVFLRRVTEAVAGALGVERVSVWSLAGDVLACDDLFERATGAHSSGARLEASVFPPYFDALGRDETIVAIDAHTHPATACFSEVYLAPLSIVSMLDVPLRSIDGVRGVVCVEALHRRAWGRAEVQFCGEVGALVVHALERSALQRVERRHGTVLASIADGVVACDEQMRVTLLNPTAEALCGVTQGAALGRSVDEVLRLVDASGGAVEPLGPRVLASGEAAVTEGVLRVVRPGGGATPVTHAASPLFEGGAVAGVVLTLRDATRDELARTQLEERARRLRSLGEAIPDLVFSVSTEGRLELLKQPQGVAERDDLLVAPDEVPRTSVREALGEGLGERVLEAVQRTLATGALQTLEYELQVPAGRQWFEARFTPLGADEATVIVRNVTREREREAALARERERLEALLASSGAIIYAARMPTFAIEYVSESMHEVLGFTSEEAKATGFWEKAVHPDDRARVVADLPNLFEHGRHVHEYRHLHRDGTYRWVRDDVRLIFDEQGVAVRAVGASLDITSRKRDEARLTTILAVQQIVSGLSNAFLSHAAEGAREALVAALGELGRTIDARRAFVARVDGGHVGRVKLWQAAGGDGVDGVARATLAGRLEPLIERLASRASSQPPARPSVATGPEPKGPEGLARGPDDDLFVVPMMLDGRLFGVMGVDAPKVESVSRAELASLMQLFADAATAGLRRGDDETALRSAADRLTGVNSRQQALIDLSTALAVASEVRDVETAVRQSIKRLVDVDSVTLGRRLSSLDHRARWAVGEVLTGDAAPSSRGGPGSGSSVVEFSTSQHDGLALDAAVRAGAPVTTLDHASDEFRDWVELRERFGFTQFAVIPLAGATGVLGTLNLASRGERTWTPDDLSWASQLALLAGGQLSTIEAAAALRRMNDDLESRVALRTHELRASEERFELLFRSAPQAMIIVDAAGKIVQSNLGAQALFGYDPASFQGLSLEALVPPESRERHVGLVKGFSERRAMRAMAGQRAIRAVRRDGVRFATEIGLVPLELGGEVQVLAGITDVSARIEAQEALSRSLREKEVLLKEIHHRVKNNLQIISSLLMLQSEQMPAESARFMRESVFRVRSMALIHQQFYGGDSLDRIDLGAYARTLVGALSSMIASSARIDVKADEVTVSVEQAVPLGLIMNELITNALKYGVPAALRRAQSQGAIDQRGADVRVEVTSAGGRLSLVVHDAGDGLPEGIDPAVTGTLGLQLVRSLSRQIRGKVTASNQGGARFEISCPLPAS